MIKFSANNFTVATYATSVSKHLLHTCCLRKLGVLPFQLLFGGKTDETLDTHYDLKQISNVIHDNAKLAKLEE